MDDDALGSVMESLDKGDMDLFTKLTPEQRAFVLQLVESMEKGDGAALEALYAVDYDRIPVDPDVFFTSSDYMGHIGKSVFKAWWGHLLKITDPASGIYEVILGGAIGGGKTQTAALILAYKIYRLSCLRDPAQVFHLTAKSRIIFGIYSVTLSQAEDVGFYKLRDQCIDQSPYFREVFPRSSFGTDFIEWPQKSIKVVTGSSSLHSLGKDLYGILLDEINFMAKGRATAEKAHDLANSVSRRQSSRFMTGMGLQDSPGITIFVSSKRAETDYLEQRIQKMKGLPGVHIVDGPIWDFVAGDKVDYCGQRFRMLIGDATHDPQILDDVLIDPVARTAKVTPALSTYEEARLEGKIIDVPVEHYKDFLADPIGALQEVAGIATSATVNFFPRKKIIQDMFDAGKDLPKFFRSERVIMPIRSPVKLTELFDLDLACGVSMSNRFPFRHPRHPRYIHVDLARNEDSCGIVMLHPSEFTFGKGEDVGGVVEDHIDKTLEVDFALRILAGDSGEDIDFRKITEFIIWLKKNGFWIRQVTYDSWNSAGSIQDLRTYGIEAGIRSTVRSALPYRVLRRVISDRKIACPMHPVLLRELGDLILKTETDQVDHPDIASDGSGPGSKDLADGLAAAVYAAVMDKLTPSDLPAPIAGTRTSKYDTYLEDAMALLPE